MTETERKTAAEIAERAFYAETGHPYSPAEAVAIAVGALAKAGLLVGELTEEQIELAAEALAKWDGFEWSGYWRGTIPRDAYRNGAKLALIAAAVTPPAPSEPPHIPFPGDPFEPDHGHDWADGMCHDPDCMAKTDGTTQPVTWVTPALVERIEALPALAPPAEVDTEEISEVIRKRLSWASMHWDLSSPEMHKAVAQAIAEHLRGSGRDE